MKFPLSRRDVTGLGGGLCASLLAPQFIRLAQAQGSLLARPIPHAPGETVPVIGIGTTNVFDGGANLKGNDGPTAVIRAMVAGGGSLIDTAPSYDEAENVIGDILTETKLRPRVLIATKLEYYEPGKEAAEARESLQRLKTNKVDILQLHNIRSPAQDMAAVNALKAQGICRFTGITTTFERSYLAAEAIIRRAKPDFLEIDYAIDNREAEQRVLPAAMDAGTAVMIASPFGRGELFSRALGKKLPDWAADFDCASWGQFFLKFILGHPAVTAVIPATDKVSHMMDNLGAGHGRMPDANERVRMSKYLESLG